MNTTTTAPITSAPGTIYSVLTPLKKSAFETALQAALEHARRLTAMRGTDNIDVAIAWETVEELQAAKAHKQAPGRSAFARYCEANPEAPESRIYDC
jgi:hypothetical protein